MAVTRYAIKAHTPCSVVYTFGDNCCQVDDKGMFLFDYDDEKQEHRALIAHWRTLGFDICIDGDVKEVPATTLIGTDSAEAPAASKLFNLSK